MDSKAFNNLKDKVEASTTGTRTSDPKYNIRGNALVNSATGKEIPRDEPIFILRAKDIKALDALDAYLRACMHDCLPEHIEAVRRRIHDFEQFQGINTLRVHTPDTDLSSWPHQE